MTARDSIGEEALRDGMGEGVAVTTSAGVIHGTRSYSRLRDLHAMVLSSEEEALNRLDSIVIAERCHVAQLTEKLEVMIARRHGVVCERVETGSTSAVEGSGKQDSKSRRRHSPGSARTRTSLQYREASMHMDTMSAAKAGSFHLCVPCGDKVKVSADAVPTRSPRTCLDDGWNMKNGPLGVHNLEENM